VYAEVGMNRRKFIKSFGAITASVPIATALANTSGAEKVIETFQMSDIEDEVIDLNELGVENFNVDFARDNGSYVAFKTPTFILTPTLNTFSNFINECPKKYGITIHKPVPIFKKEHLLGIGRDARFIGLYQWWIGGGNRDGRLQEILHIKESIVLSPGQYFRSIHL